MKVTLDVHILYIKHYHTLPPKGKGVHYTYPTLLNNELIMVAVCQYLTVLADGKVSLNRTQNNKINSPCVKIMPLHLMQQVNNVIVPSLELNLSSQLISELTAWHWLIKLGYKLKEVKKGVYINGHNQNDVITYQNQFLKDFNVNER